MLLILMLIHLNYFANICFNSSFFNNILTLLLLNMHLFNFLLLLNMFFFSLLLFMLLILLHLISLDGLFGILSSWTAVKIKILPYQFLFHFITISYLLLN